MLRSVRRWYPISFIGGLVTGLYALLPPYIIYIDRLGFLPFEMRVAAGTCMAAIAGILILCRRKNIKPFQRLPKRPASSRDAFTLIELLVVISIIGILASLIFPSFQSARENAYLSRARSELKTIASAVQIYSLDSGSLPADVSRDLPSGLEEYLGPGEWPDGPWPGSVYDWDNWEPDDLAYPPFERVVQVSIRFCPLNGQSQCNFPPFAQELNFDYYSGVYYCIEGPCRAHGGQPLAHPGLCINC